MENFTSPGLCGSYVQRFREEGNGRMFFFVTPNIALTYCHVGYLLRTLDVRCKTRIKLKPKARTSSPNGVRKYVATKKEIAPKHAIRLAATGRMDWK